MFIGCFLWLEIYATSGAGTDYPSGASEFTTVLCKVHDGLSLIYYVVFCRSLFVLFLAIVVSVIFFIDGFWFLF
jgi:hypothetical protein